MYESPEVHGVRELRLGRKEDEVREYKSDLQMEKGVDEERC